jgi:hypothetical protein
MEQPQVTSYPQPPDGLALAEIDGVAYVQTAGPVVIALRGTQQLLYCAALDWPASPAAQHAARESRIAAIEAELAALKAQTAPPPLLAAPATATKRGPYERRAPKPAIVACPHCEKPCVGRAGVALHCRRAHPGLGFDWPSIEAAQTAPVAPEEPEPELPEPELPPPPVTLASADGDQLLPCPQCGLSFKPRGLAVHVRKIHGDGADDPAPPPAARAADAISPDEAQARLVALNAADDPAIYACPSCRSSAFSESLKRPGMCVACSKARDRQGSAQAQALAAD